MGFDFCLSQHVPVIRKHLGRSAGVCVFTLFAEVDGKTSPQGPGFCTASQRTLVFCSYICLCEIFHLMHVFKKKKKGKFFNSQNVKPGVFFFFF